VRDSRGIDFGLQRRRPFHLSFLVRGVQNPRDRGHGLWGSDHHSGKFLAPRIRARGGLSGGGRLRRATVRGAGDRALLARAAKTDARRRNQSRQGFWMGADRAQDAGDAGGSGAIISRTELPDMRFTKIVVVNPPSPPGYVSNKDSMGGFGQLFSQGATYLPPLDLVYLASYIAEREVPLDVFECLGLELTTGQLTEKIASAGGVERGLVVVRTSAPTLDWDLSVCREIKAGAGTARICVYGPVVS